MIQILPVLLIFLNVVIAFFLVVLYLGLKKYENTLNSYYDSKAKKTLEGANKQAQKIIEDADVFTNEMQQSVKTQVENSLKQTKSTIDHFYKQVEENTQSEVKSFLEQIGNYYKESANKIQDEINKGTVSKQLEVEQIIDQKMKSTLTQLEDYKKDKINNMNSEINQILKEEILKILPQYVKIQDQEKMALEVIEKAKKQNNFLS